MNAEEGATRDSVRAGFVLCSTGTGLEQGRFDHGTQSVVDGQVVLLDLEGFLLGHDDADVGDVLLHTESSGYLSMSSSRMKLAFLSWEFMFSSV